MGQTKESQIAFMGDRRAFALEMVEEMRPILLEMLREFQRADGEMLRVKEAAKILKMSEANVRRAIEEGRLPAEDWRAEGARNAQWRILKSNLVKFKKGGKLI